MQMTHTPADNNSESLKSEIADITHALGAGNIERDAYKELHARRVELRRALRILEEMPNGPA